MDSNKKSIIYDFKRDFPEKVIEDTISIFKEKYNIELEHIEEFENLKEYNIIENSLVDDKGINHYITGNDVINYYLFVTRLPEEKLKCEIVIILKRYFSSVFIKKIDRIVLFESYPSLKKDGSKEYVFKEVKPEKEKLNLNIFENRSIYGLQTYRIKNYEELNYLPNMDNLKQIVSDVNKNKGCFGASCFSFGGKKSKRKLIRKSNRKSKKLKKTQKIKKNKKTYN